MKRYARLLTYVSFVFLVIALYRANYLRIPRFVNLWALAGSIPFLLAGFVMNGVCWQRTLKAAGYPARLDDCIASVGLSIFTKYIPGKLWMIVGRATYVAARTGAPVSRLSSLSLNAQMIALWLGLVFGFAGLVMLRGLHLWGWMVAGLWAVLSAIIFSPYAHGIAEIVLRRLLKKEISLPQLPWHAAWRVMGWFALYWVCYSAGFYLLVASMLGGFPPLAVGGAYPLAGTLGILTVFAPGGLGTREAVLTGYLRLAGVELARATSIALAARLWFLAGEAAIFLTGLALSHHVRPGATPAAAPPATPRG
jgi:uncharacterized membrane protein YbhN (UPF0104 family)